MDVVQTLTNNTLSASTVQQTADVMRVPMEISILLILLAFIIIMTLILGTFALIKHKIKVERCKCSVYGMVEDHEERLLQLEAKIGANNDQGNSETTD